MNKDSVLKKEFKQSDVQRVRNIVNKDFTAKTKSQTGYQKKFTRHTEGDVWEENGKSWTIKNGIKQNITKLDSAKKAMRIPLACPKCGGSMKHHLAKKMYNIHGFCFDCTIDYEASLKEAGLYDEYEKNFLQGNIKTFLNNIESFTLSLINNKSDFVTEQGDVEDWNNNSSVQKNKLLKNLQTYMDIVSKHVQ
jgi:hypothetical protein